MTQTRRIFLATAAAAAATTVLPFAAKAANHEADTFDTAAGPITVHPVDHASFVMQTPAGTIYCDPVGNPASYADFPAADLILITHEHGDHFNVETLSALAQEKTQIIANPAVHALLPEPLRAKATAVANGEIAKFNELSIDAVPAYNITPERKQFHPRGRDNGYVINFPGFRVYVSGDSEDTEEMRHLTDIDLAFLSMNLPFTMDAKAAASAVAAFRPTYVYPYHYRGRDGGTQDPAAFAEMVGQDAQVRIANWYG